MDSATRRKLRSDLESWSTRKGALICQKAVDSEVRAFPTTSGGWAVSGVKRCASPWACPICSPLIAARRGEEIANARRAYDGPVTFLTLTMQHSIEDDLKTLLDRLTKAFRRFTQRRAWRNLNVFGYISALEITYGSNGWHPHRHILVFGVEPKVIASLAAVWADVVGKTGGHASMLHGFDARAADDKASSYLAKLGYELSAGALKASSPWRFALQACDRAEGTESRSHAAALWTEFESATAGRAAIRWSVGLRDKLGVEVLEDEEAAVGDPVLTGADGYEIDKTAWNGWRRGGREFEFLESIRALHLAGARAGPGWRVVPADEYEKMQERIRHKTYSVR